MIFHKNSFQGRKKSTVSWWIMFKENLEKLGKGKGNGKGKGKGKGKGNVLSFLIPFCLLSISCYEEALGKLLAPYVCTWRNGEKVRGIIVLTDLRKRINLVSYNYTLQDLRWKNRRYLLV